MRPEFYKLVVLAAMLAMISLIAWLWSGRFLPWSLSKPSLRWAAVLFLTSAFACAGVAQYLYNENLPILVAVGTVTQIDQDHGKNGMPEDSGSFRLLADSSDVVTLSTYRWIGMLTGGQRIRVFYQEKTSLLGNRTFDLVDHVEFLSDSGSVLYSLTNAINLRRKTNPWFVAALLLILLALPRPRRDGSTGGVNASETE